MFPKLLASTNHNTKSTNTKLNASFSFSQTSPFTTMQFSKSPQNANFNLTGNSNPNNPENNQAQKKDNFHAFNIDQQLKAQTKHRIEFSRQIKNGAHQSLIPTVELQLKISSLQAENRRNSQEHQLVLSKLKKQKQYEFNNLNSKIELMSEHIAKDKLEIQQMGQKIKFLEIEKVQIIEKLGRVQSSHLDSVKKYKQNTKQLQNYKQESKKDQNKISQISNKYSLLELQLASSQNKLKYAEENLKEAKNKDDHWKNMVIKMSHEKTLLNNRISQILQQQAKMENSQVITRLKANHAVCQEANKSCEVQKEMIKEIQYLKNRIDQMLIQQQTGGLKAIYEEKIMRMEGQIEQLKHRYQSPQSLKLSHNNKQQQLNGMLDSKNRQIEGLKNVINNLQSKINHLNKLLQTEHSKHSSLSQNESQLNSFKNQNKNQKRALQLLDQKIKYLIAQSRKKDHFLSEYLSTTVDKVDEGAFIQNFFKKYELQIPADGFHKVMMNDARIIQQLQERVKYYSGKLYEKK